MDVNQSCAPTKVQRTTYNVYLGYIVRRTTYNASCSLYIIHYLVNNACMYRIILYTLMYTVYCTVYAVHRALQLNALRNAIVTRDNLNIV